LKPSLLSIATILALAGCLNVPETVDDVAEKGPPNPILEFESLKVGPGGDAETAVHVSPDGKTVLACSHGGFNQPSPMWASEDGGETFRRLDPQPNPVPSGDCDLAITDNGDWFIVYDTLASATVAGTSDKGRTWRIYPIAAPPFGGVDRPWIQPVGNNLYLVYADVMSAEPFNAMFTKSTDGGRTWSPPELMGTFPNQGQPNCFMGHPIVRDAGQTIHVPINCWDGVRGAAAPFANTIHLLHSRDGGRTWITLRVRGPDASAHRIVTAAYAGDAIALAFTTGHPRLDVNVILSRDGAKTWSEPLVVARGTSMPLAWPWIDARPDGSATIAWMNVTTNTTRTWQVHAARIQTTPTASLDWQGPVGPPASGNVIYEFLMVRHDQQGHAYIVYPMPGDNCRSAPAGPSGASRNQQCVHLLREAS
jgi:hypothetical protein